MIEFYSRPFLIEHLVHVDGNMNRLSSVFGYYDASTMRHILERRGIRRIKKPGKPLIICVKADK